MADIKQCDICKKPYEPYGEEKNPENPNGFSWLNIKSCSYAKPYYYICKLTDTCQVCRGKIMDFIDELKNNPDGPDEEEPPIEGGDQNEETDPEGNT